MFIPVYAWLRESATIRMLLGDPSRIYRTLSPQDEQYPRIVWQVVAGTVENYLGEPPGIDNAIIQFDVYGRDEAEMELLSFAVSRTLETKGHQRGVPRDVFEGAPTKLYRMSIDFSFWENRDAISPL